MKRSSKGAAVGKIAAYVLIFFAIAGIVGFIAVYTNGFTDDFSSFYVECENEKILSKQEKHVPFDEEVRFDVRYVFGSGSKKGKGYSVKVAPAEGADFDFTVDGQTYSFAAETDLTAGFDIEKKKEYFILRIPKDFSIRQVLKKVYEGKEVGIADATVPEKACFELIISSYNDKARIRIPLRFRVGVEAVNLNKEQIVLW